MKKSVKFISLLLACGMLMSMASCSKKDKEPDAEQMQEQIDTVAEKLEEIKSDKDYEDLDPDEKADLVMDELKTLSKKGHVNANSINYDEDTKIITYAYGSGILACELLESFDYGVDENSGRIGTSTVISNDENYYSSRNDRHAQALILDAMTDREAVKTMCRDLAQTWSYEGIDTKFDVSVTLDDLCDLSDYQFVLFELHGNYLDYTDLKKDYMLPVIFLEQAPTKKTLGKYTDDFYSGRIGVKNGKELFVCPSFFTEHYKDDELSDCIFLFGSCEFMGKNNIFAENWSYTLNDLNLSAFVGFHNVVYTYYTIDFAKCFMNLLINNFTVQEAYDYAVETCFDNDVDYLRTYWNPKEPLHSPAAYPELRGNTQAYFAWTIGVCPVDEPVEVDSTEVYSEYYYNTLLPEYGLTKTGDSYFSIAAGNQGLEYKPIEYEIEAAGVLSADIDDYNRDGVDDLIVICICKESAQGVDSPYTDPTWFSSPQTEIYRAKLMAFTISGNKVVKTDEYDVLQYGNTKQNEYLVGCLFTQEQDNKRFDIIKIIGENGPSLLFENRVTAGPMFKYYEETAWMMGLDTDGKFYMQSCYIGGGITNGQYSIFYEFSNGVEMTCSEYQMDMNNPTYEPPAMTDYYDKCHISYDDFRDGWGIYKIVSENDKQIKLTEYNTEITNDSENNGFFVCVTFIDSGSLSSKLR